MNKKLGIIIFTIIETAGLIIWRALIIQARAVLGVLVLFLGFIGEHFLAFKTLVGTKFPKKQLTGISISEGLIWIIWLPLTEISILLGSAFFFAAMWIQHSVEKNIFEGRPAFERLFRRNVLVFTWVETVGANGWILFINAGQETLGLGLLFASLTVEHFIQSEI